MRRMIVITLAAMSFAAALQAQEPRRASSPPPAAPAPRARVAYAAPEPAPRACAATRGASPSQQETTGRDALGRILPPSGIAALQAGTRGQLQGAAPARNVEACYRTDGRGR